MKIILDTNILIYAARRGVDLKGAVSKLDVQKPQILVPEVVVEELKTLIDSARHSSDKDAAKLALQIIKHKRFSVRDIGSGHADQVIATWAQKHKAAVVTNDAQLSLKLKELGVPVYSLRQGRYIYEK